jgi:hypothetical protein
MTARSGDALSHVNFQAGQTPFLTAIKLSQIRLRRTHRDIALRPRSDWFRPYLHGGHERSGRNEPRRLLFI